MRRVTALLSVLLTALALASSAGTSQGIVVTRDAVSLPDRCGPREVAGLVERFFDAFNAGDWDAVDEVVAPAGPAPPGFALFSLDRDAVVYDRERLVAYLADVRSRGERFRLVATRAAPGMRHSTAAVVYAFEGTDGIAPGKGVVDCVSLRIWQWAMATPARGTPPIPCPQPRDWSPSGAVLACTTGPNARTVASDFRLETRSNRVPRPCRPTPAFGKLRSALSAFNAGLGTALGKHFVKRARFHPYTLSEAQLVGRASIAHFVGRRYDAGDGWTATALHAPRRTNGTTAVFTLDLLLSSLGEQLTSASAAVVFDCTSGLIRVWRGPAVAAP
jgi:hypothetical protein